MKFLFALLVVCFLFPRSGWSQEKPTQIMLLGCDHLRQTYKKDNPNTDVFTARRQQELADLISRIRKFQPDLIVVERVPEGQAALDSTYALYVANKLQLADMEDGRGEEYQLGFALGKQLGLKRIVGVNAPGGTSQSILSNGQNIDLYKEEGVQMRTFSKAKQEELASGKLTLTEYFTFLNQPAVTQMIYHLRYITPARVTNGHFTNPDAMVDTAFVNPRYIGAELTSVFKNRDYKIYSNIVTTQMAEKAKRVLVLIGGAHIGSLQSIFRDDPAYQLVPATTYLGKTRVSTSAVQ
ncbi:DUF5694 domain-containing protein [Hymenobacter sp. GOD-10R]|uniref:DUF5694 domain-containing protein n=1 Tax=Hymenobacter sp. GOD-10R TaxID=3093922 RepID=UPI002D79AE7F|nr:DUF5694 domain-containing protein [Hymenobacter sp. GOD-10R]WRQ30394.1 DUF5694 domain-containing protein [Hymenobacter sp. GOD-10R]